MCWDGPLPTSGARQSAKVGNAVNHAPMGFACVMNGGSDGTRTRDLRLDRPGALGRKSRWRRALRHPRRSCVLACVLYSSHADARRCTIRRSSRLAGRRAVPPRAELGAAHVHGDRAGLVGRDSSERGRGVGRHVLRSAGWREASRPLPSVTLLPQPSPFTDSGAPESGVYARFKARGSGGRASESNRPIAPREATQRF